MSSANRFASKNGFDANNKTLINVSDPVNPQDAATKAWASNAANLTTGTLAAAQLPAFSGDATSSAGSSALTLAASGVSVGTYTKVTVDAKGRVTVGAQLASADVTTALGFTPLSNAGGNVSGNIVMTSAAILTGLPAPVDPSDATNKNYVDTSISSAVNGVSWKQEAQVATTANITLSGTQTIDGYSVVAGNRVLVKNQTNQTENGVYVAAVGAWARGSDTDTGVEILGMAILVLNGTAYGLTQWVNNNSSAITLGSTNITFAQLQGAGIIYTAGTGLTLTGSQYSITNTGVVVGTYTKVTVNAQGQVTTGAQLASGDVTTALGFTPLAANGTLPLTNGLINSASLVTSTTAANQVVDTFSAALYRAAKYVVQVTSGSSYHMTEINVLHDGTTVSIAEFATMFTGVSLATFDASISGGNLSLTVTPTNAVTTIKVVRTSVSV